MKAQSAGKVQHILYIMLFFQDLGKGDTACLSAVESTKKCDDKNICFYK